MTFIVAARNNLSGEFLGCVLGVCPGEGWFLELINDRVDGEDLEGFDATRKHLDSSRIREPAKILCRTTAGQVIRGVFRLSDLKRTGYILC